MATILVVDDRPIDRDYLTTLFRYAGHRPIEAGDGIEALELLATERPDIIITDVLMPRMDGFDFVRALRELPAFATTPVLFYSATYHEREARALAEQCGAIEVLTKPSEPDEILTRLAAALARLPDPTLVAAVSPTFDQQRARVATDKLLQKEQELQIGARRMAALLSLSEHLTAERDPATLLQEICHVAREMTLARHAVIGIIDDDGERMGLLLTSGLTPAVTEDLRQTLHVDERTRAVVTTRLTVRTRNPSGDPRALDLPPSHPPAHSLLMVPVTSPRHGYGWLAVSEKLGADEFSTADEQLVRLLGGQAGIAYENSSLIRELTARAERMRREEERTDFALAAAQVGVWQRDLLTGQVTLSRSAAQLLGLGDESFRASQQSIYGRVHPDDQQRTRAVVEQAARERGEFSVEFRANGSNGAWRWFQSRGRTDSDASGTPVRLIGVIIDVTERELLERQLRQSQKMEAVGQLAGGVAHDFNNLLTAILGYGRFLLEEVGDPEQRRDIEQIVKAATRAAGLTKQLLAFSRRQVIEAQVLDVNSIIDDMAAMLTRLIGENITLSTALAPELPHIKADRGHLEQVIMNLVVNARDAMPEGGRIRLETAETDAIPDDAAVEPRPGLDGADPPVAGFVRLRVADNGAGMSEDTKAHLFEPFFTTKGRAQGTGLGLATVYGIVTQAGGTIVVHSTLGEGSTFDIYLPQTAEVARTTTDRPAPRPHGRERVLLVEDEEAVRELTAIILRRAGFTVFDAANPDDAVAVFSAQAGSIDALLTDVIMPGGTGPELFARLAALQPELRVLFMSGYTDAAVPPLLMAGADAVFVQKPFTAEGLLQKLREVLDR